MSSAWAEPGGGGFDSAGPAITIAAPAVNASRIFMARTHFGSDQKCSDVSIVIFFVNRSAVGATYSGPTASDDGILSTLTRVSLVDLNIRRCSRDREMSRR
jgi:hypothetical protein